MKVSEWQEGFPPCDGIWEIAVPEHSRSSFNGVYRCRFKDGEWGAGAAANCLVERFYPYPPNNDPSNPRKWRGVIDE